MELAESLSQSSMAHPEISRKSISRKESPLNPQRSTVTGRNTQLEIISAHRGWLRIHPAALSAGTITCPLAKSLARVLVDGRPAWALAAAVTTVARSSLATSATQSQDSTTPTRVTTET